MYQSHSEPYNPAVASGLCSNPTLKRNDGVWHTEHPSIQWLSTCAAFADTGGMVSGEELGERLRAAVVKSGGNPDLQVVSLVARWIASKEAVAVLGPYGWMLPLFQFDMSTVSLKPCMKPLLAELKGVFNQSELAMWFVAPNDWLEGERPAMVMLHRLHAAVHAARADRYVAAGS